MTPAARELLAVVVDALDGRSWGPHFARVVDALEASGSTELLGVLVAAGDGVAGAWDEIVANVEEGAGLVALDLVTELAERRYASGAAQLAGDFTSLAPAGRVGAGHSAPACSLQTNQRKES